MSFILNLKELFSLECLYCYYKHSMNENIWLRYQDHMVSLVNNEILSLYAIEKTYRDASVKGADKTISLGSALRFCPFNSDFLMGNNRVYVKHL